MRVSTQVRVCVSLQGAAELHKIRMSNKTKRLLQDQLGMQIMGKVAAG